MIIELRGVEFVNKGAELMLHAIVEKIRQKYPQALIAMQVGSQTPKTKLKQYGIYVKFSNNRSNRIGRLIPRVLRLKAGYVLEREVDLVMDGSGFAFGDQWGAAYAQRRLGSQITQWHNDGKKIILLSQAFGPFENAELKQVMKKIIANSHLIFAREEESFQYLTGLKPADHIIKAPDFTNLIQGILPHDFNTATHQVAIIPNYKMIDKGSQGDNVYLSFLKHTIKKVIELGLKPFFLIHEGKQDLELAEKVNTMLDTPLDVTAKENPLEIKGIIAVSKFIVCSRFHGVVSALSQGVPCVVTGWSHKYKMLLNEYDYDEGLISDLSDTNTVDNMLQKLATPEINKQISDKLKTNSLLQKENSKKMWDRVYNLIDAN